MPASREQVGSRTDFCHSDYHTRNCDMPMMLGCVTALTKTTKENGATICIPGSHLWGPERCPYDHEAVPAELEPGSALIFVGNLYHAGGGNITKYDILLFPSPKWHLSLTPDPETNPAKPWVSSYANHSTDPPKTSLSWLALRKPRIYPLKRKGYLVMASVCHRWGLSSIRIPCATYSESKMRRPSTCELGSSPSATESGED